MFLQDERGRNGCIFCLIILRVFFWSVGREGFSAKVLEKRLPFVVRVRMPLARTQHGLGQRGAVCWLALLRPVEVCCSSQMAYQYL